MREDCMELGPITSSRREECLPRIVGRPSVRDKIEKSRLYIYQGGWCSSSRGIEWHSNIFIKSVWTWKSHLRLYLSEVYSRNVLRRREYFEYLLQFSIIRNSFRFFFFSKSNCERYDLARMKFWPRWNWLVHVVPVKFINTRTCWQAICSPDWISRSTSMSTDKRLPYQKAPLFMRALRAKRIPRLCWERSTSSGNYAKPRPFVTNHTVVRHEASCDCVIASV